MTTQQVRQQLETIAGVSPSTTWLQACLSALHIDSTSRSDVQVTAALVLEQVLRHDLRDVVQEVDDVDNHAMLDGANSNSNSTNSSPSWRQLRRAIQESKVRDDRKVILSESFRLLVQLEECVDVAVNAERRMATYANTMTTHVGVAAIGSRCLKFCYSDGRLNSRNDENQVNTAAAGGRRNGAPPPMATSVTLPLMAMEGSPPIAQLSVHSAAGVKLLLTGPMTIRHGLAGWHAGNVVVLSSTGVDALVAIQQQARQRAQQRTGHGIDPTIKALIWNQQGHENDDDDRANEGDRASEDVVVAPQLPIATIPVPRAAVQMAPPPPPQRLPPQPLPRQPPSAVARPPALATNPYPSTRPMPYPPPPSLPNQPQRQQQEQQHRHLPYPPMRSGGSGTSSLAVATTTIHTSNGGYASAHAASVITPTMSSTPSTATVGPTASAYSRRVGGSMTSVSTATTTTTAASQTLAPRSTTMAATTFHGTGATVTTTTSSIHRSQPPPPPPQQQRPSSNGSGIYAPRTNMSTTVTVTGSTQLSISGPAVTAAAVSTALSPAPSMPVASSSTSSATAVTLSFGQFRDLVARAVSNVATYQHIFDTTYAVQMKQKGPKLHFNIDKKRNGKEKTKQYEYVMIAKFGVDEVDTPGVLTCLLSSAILEPHFPIAPSEMRKLNREDKAKADVMVREGGVSVQQCLHQLAWYDVKLHIPPSAYFETGRVAIDGDKPFLYLVRRR